jgi:hypothetical protein
MLLSLKRVAVIGCAFVCTAVGRPGWAWANGQEFFAAPFGKVDLVYTGRVRDVTGRFLYRAEVVIWSEELGLTFPSITDENGHYRSPDVGANIKEVASVIDPKGLKAACALPGYDQVRPLTIPKKTRGVVELNCTLRKTGSVSETAADHDTPARPTPPFFWLVPAGLAILVIGGAARR